MPHCSAQSLAPHQVVLWEEIMKRLGIPLQKRTVGCCDMAGLFGHEKKNDLLSKKIFNTNWRDNVNKKYLVEGFSIRC